MLCGRILRRLREHKRTHLACDHRFLGGRRPWFDGVSEAIGERVINPIKSLCAAHSACKEQKRINQAWDEEYSRAKPAEYPCTIGQSGITDLTAREWRGPVHDGETGATK